ncbi:MAG: fibronectin type III domain-containing protein [Flavobacteriales bacterium]|nr:fibronectin type III domain-containing protein [Flavobacteriales bacterium]
MAFQEAKDIFHLMGGYVQLASGADLETILSAGLEVESKPMPKPAPLAPTNVRAIATKGLGQIIVLFGGSKGRRVYKVYQTEGVPSLETGWELIAETGKVRVVVDGLDRFKTYSFRVVAEGVAGVSVPSDAASARAAWLNAQPHERGGPCFTPICKRGCPERDGPFFFVVNSEVVEGLGPIRSGRGEYVQPEGYFEMRLFKEARL